MAKLVEILARAFSHWPEGAKSVIYGDCGSTASFDMGVGYRDCIYLDELEQSQLGDGIHVVTRAEWQAAVDALKAKEAVEWDGVGLPPVGTTCERRFPDVRESSWNGCIILAHGARKIFVRDNCGDEWAHHLDEVEFRPFRTPEQIAANEREDGIESIRQLLSKVACDDFHAAVAIYDAGYRKQEPK